MAVQYFEGIGRRKESIARVRIMKGSRQFIVNQKPVAEYFTRYGDTEAVLAPIQALGESPSLYDVTVIVRGGGVNGQKDAVQMGLARALVIMNPASKPMMRKEGFLTRDPRIKERKKPGLKRARKAPT
jgi:small subunit ribosomal protein S9